MGKTFLFKVVLIGEGSVGKTSTLNRFVKGNFDAKYILTIGANFLKKEVKFKKITANLMIWDMAGQKRFESIRKQFYTQTAGALLFFDLTRAESFEKMNYWLNELNENAGDVPFILIGNKVDLIEETGRTVDPKKSEEFASSRGSIYIETSAKTGENVEDAFEELVRRMAASKGIKIK